MELLPSCSSRTASAVAAAAANCAAAGVSHVNELDSVRALRTLKAWVQHNPKYAGLELQSDAYSDGTLMDEVSAVMPALCAFT